MIKLADKRFPHYAASKNVPYEAKLLAQMFTGDWYEGVAIVKDDVLYIDIRQVSDQWGYIKNQIKSKAEVSQDIINEILEDRVSAETSAYFQSYLEGQGYQDYLEGVNEQHRK